jgi:serine/threonine protein kinase
MSIHGTCPACRHLVPLSEGDTQTCPVCRHSFSRPVPSGEPAPTLEPLAGNLDSPPTAPPGPAEVPARIGRFEVRQVVGEGGFGVVYRAFDPVTRREIALKVARPELLHTPQRVKRFLREG